MDWHSHTKIEDTEILSLPKIQKFHLNSWYRIFVETHSFRPKHCGNFAFPQNFYIRKLGEMLAFTQRMVFLVYVLCYFFFLSQRWSLKTKIYASLVIFICVIFIVTVKILNLTLLQIRHLYRIQSSRQHIWCQNLKEVPNQGKSRQLFCRGKILQHFRLHSGFKATFQRSKGIFNQFQANILLLYPIKASEKQWFSNVFRNYRKGTFGWEQLKVVLCFSTVFKSLAVIISTLQTSVAFRKETSQG